MEFKLYILLLVYFLVGAIIMLFVNKNRDYTFRKNNWVKYIVYFILVNLLFVSILINPVYFHAIAIAILILGLYELIKSIIGSGRYKAGIFVIATFSAFAIACYHFSLMPRAYLFYTLYLTTVFDAFSQLTGQLLGKKKLLSAISPNKTVEGLLGGITSSVLTSVFIRQLLNISVTTSILIGFGLAASAFIGDILASVCKRNFDIKDFSKLIPGHGGILDRFDSLITAGTFIFLTDLFTEI